MVSRFRKYLNFNNYFIFFSRFLIPRNILVNKVARAAPFKSLLVLDGIRVDYQDFDNDAYLKWIDAFFPDWHKNLYHKKLIEFFASYSLLDPKPNDIFIDVAGGIYTYLKNLNCQKKYLNDLVIPSELRSFLGPDIKYLEGNASKINLPNASVDKIVCHHSFEHFQGDADILFLKEVQRLLKIGGRCCIVPIFIANRYLEITDSFWLKRKFDRQSIKIIDPTSGLPGGKRCGNYARVYDQLSFQRRILGSIDLSRFKVSILELKLSGQSLPYKELTCHKDIATINYPYRALLIERLQ